jgi:predicted AlkP superfamily pyrophosphatase or phosphodiesterase
MKPLFFLLALAFAQPVYAQVYKEPVKPKLVVGIVVDQMRAEYLQRYAAKYSDRGFKRMMREGYHFRNHHFEYFPTYTAPGHASVYTGTGPAHHGIIGNDWFVEATGKNMYCVGDSTVKTVGANSRNGEMSPENLMANTITDQLRLSTSFQAKVVGISMKDRGAVLPAGHFGQAYWYDESIGGFITSTYYRKELPVWAKSFNDAKPVDKLLSQDWVTLLPIEQYTESLQDDNPWEGRLRGEDKPVFPHKLPLLRKLNGPGVLRDSPFGNTLVVDFARAAIEGENLGNNSVPDFLALSFSSPDYLGHRFGPHSIEVQDTYLRLDLLLGEFFDYLDAKFGKDGYLVFLTADHAGEDNPGWLASLGQTVNYFNGPAVVKKLKSHLFTQFGDSLVREWNNQQIYFDRTAITSKKLDFDAVESETARFLSRHPGVAAAYTGSALRNGQVNSPLGKFVQNGFLAQRSGGVTVIFSPGWLEYNRTGTTHGSPWVNDTHVPMLFMGKGIPNGFSVKRTGITDIAPTLSMLLGIRLPNAASGHPMPFE